MKMVSVLVGELAGRKWQVCWSTCGRVAMASLLVGVMVGDSGMCFCDNSGQCLVESSGKVAVVSALVGAVAGRQWQTSWWEQ